MFFGPRCRFLKLRTLERGVEEWYCKKGVAGKPPVGLLGARLSFGCWAGADEV